MRHLIVFYYILTFSSGLIGLVISFMIFFKTRIRIVLVYLLFYLLLSSLVISNTFYFYITSVIEYQNVMMDITFAFIFFATFSLLIYYGPLLVHLVNGKPFTGIKKAVFGILSVTAVFMVTIPFFVSRDINQILDILWFELYTIYINISYAVIIYVVLYSFFNYKNLKMENTKIMVKTGLILLVVFFPGFILDGYWKLFQVELKVIPRYFNFMPVFYFFWSIFTIVYTGKYLFVPAVGSGSKYMNISNIVIPGKFVEKYNISKRESEIICLMLQGLNSLELGKKLFISPGTVKNHIHNIYGKTQTGNRIELAGLIKKYSD